MLHSFDPPDDTSPARGIANGMLLSAFFWGLIGAIWLTWGLW